MKWPTLRDRVLRVLDDTDRAKPTWTDADMLDYVNLALNGIAASHTAREREYTITPASPLTQFDLPDDFIAVSALRLNLPYSSTMLEPQRWQSGQTYLRDVQYSDPSAYHEWPAGTIVLNAPLNVGKSLYVAYWGYWDEVEGTSSMVPVPRWMEEALYWRIMELALSKPGIQTSMLGNYKTKTDSGAPEDNPALRYAKHCYEQYTQVLLAHPGQDRTGWESN